MTMSRSEEQILEKKSVGIAGTDSNQVASPTRKHPERMQRPEGGRRGLDNISLRRRRRSMSGKWEQSIKNMGLHNDPASLHYVMSVPR